MSAREGEPTGIGYRGCDIVEKHALSPGRGDRSPCITNIVGRRAGPGYLLGHVRHCAHERCHVCQHERDHAAGIDYQDDTIGNTRPFFSPDSNDHSLLCCLIKKRGGTGNRVLLTGASDSMDVSVRGEINQYWPRRQRHDRKCTPFAPKHKTTAYDCTVGSGVCSLTY